MHRHFGWAVRSNNVRRVLLDDGDDLIVLSADSQLWYILGLPSGEDRLTLVHKTACTTNTSIV